MLQNQLEQLISEKRLDQKRVIIYGSGMIGRTLLYAFLDLGLVPAYFIDRSAETKPSEFAGIPIRPPHHLTSEAENTYIVMIANAQPAEMIRQLQALGVPEQAYVAIELETEIHPHRFTSLQEQLKIHPYQHEKHVELGWIHLLKGKQIAATACLRTGITLGADGVLLRLLLAEGYRAVGLPVQAVKQLAWILERFEVGQRVKDCLTSFQSSLSNQEDSDFKTMHHNKYYRIKTIFECIQTSLRGDRISIMDIGGGEGELSLFFPDAEYVLIEPAINGLSTNELVTYPKTFDYVVSCHVLEHVPQQYRTEFLDTLCAFSKHRVILLNPFTDQAEDLTEWQELIYDITKLDWVKEHLECQMPALQDVIDYADQRRLVYRVESNGHKLLSTALFFLEYYMKKHVSAEETKRVMSMFNRQSLDRYLSESTPNAFLVELEIKSQQL